MNASTTSDKNLCTAADKYAARSPQWVLRRRKDVAEILFECSLRGFHRDASKIILAHEERFAGYSFHNRAFSSGARAVLGAGQSAEYIYLVHVLAATRAIDDIRSYRRNIRYALREIPKDFRGLRGNALDQSIKVAEGLDNRVFYWEAKKHLIAKRSPLEPMTPNYPSNVSPIGTLARRRPQP